MMCLKHVLHCNKAEFLRVRCPFSGPFHRDKAGLLLTHDHLKVGKNAKRLAVCPLRPLFMGPSNQSTNLTLQKLAVFAAALPTCNENS
mmetsp:Transcript_25992/g.53185  ORF Transcript_25992/g.53185 Transcript_25992/m.53185 type:complete len:88 (+) Transcript_25992:418-681(+)